METGFFMKANFKKGGLAAAIACAAALLAAPPPSSHIAYAADWPMFRGNAARTGYAAEQAAPPLTPAWTFRAGGGILSSPAVFEGVVYFGARDGGVYALDAGTGARLWRFQAANWVDASPCVSGSLVYAVSIDGSLYALDKQTGVLAWRRPLGSQSVSSPLVSAGKIYVGTGLPEKKLKVFDALTGAPLGSFQAGQPVDSAPAAYGANIYFGANDGNIYALDRDSLLPAWWTHYPTAGSFRMNAVAVSSGVVYALPGHDDKKVYALSAVTGTQISSSAPVEVGESWQTFTSPVITGGRVYFAGAIGESGTEFAGNNYLSALASQDLSSVWASSPSLGAIADMGMLSSPAMANDILYAGTVDGRLVAASSAGVSLQFLNLSSAAYSSPAVANGRVFIGTMGGDLFAFSADKIASISAPAAGEIAFGDVTLRGYVVNPALAGYMVHYSSGGVPEIWNLISSNATDSPVEDAELAVWDASALPNGYYTVRLTVLESGAPALDNTALLTLRINAPPPALSGLAAADVPGDSGNRIALSWSTAAPAGLTATRIYRYDSVNDTGLIASVASDATTYIDAAAVTGTTYTYTVRSFDGYLESEDSDPAEAYSTNDTGDNTPPARVSDLRAEPGSAPGIVLLVWTGTGNDGVWGSASHYIIKYSTSPDHNWAGFDTSQLAGSIRPVDGPAGIREAEEVKGLLGGVTYYFALKAADSVGNISQLSNPATSYAAADPVPPQPPFGLTVIDTPGDGGGRLSLAWALSPDDGAGADDVYGYRIYRRLQSSSYVPGAPYAAVPGGVGAYTDAAAPENVKFYYSVAAFDSTNNSALSNEAWGVSADNWRFFDAAQGGSVRLADGARVDLRGGAASQNDRIMFIKVDPASYQPLFSIKAAAQANPTDIVYEVKFQNPATRLLSPALVSLPYTDGAVVGMVEENLRLYTLSGGAWAMLNTSAVDAQAKKVSAEVSHFSIFRIMEYLPSGGLFSGDEVYTYPNPAKGDTVTFKFKLSDKAYVKVDVYNVAGEQVASLEKANCPAGQTSEIVWITKNIASGIYIYRVRAESASGSKAIIKKLAVIH